MPPIKVPGVQAAKVRATWCHLSSHAGKPNERRRRRWLPRSATIKSPVSTSTTMPEGVLKLAPPSPAPFAEPIWPEPAIVVIEALRVPTELDVTAPEITMRRIV